jgi:hypothetical protein
MMLTVITIVMIIIVILFIVIIISHVSPTLYLCSYMEVLGFNK